MRTLIADDQPDVVEMIVVHGLGLTLIGLAIGLALASAVTLAVMLYAVAPTDAWTFGGVAVFPLAVGVLASWLPSRRAARLKPMDALRTE
jgi:ABC-type antimicrobial peptide transport system permease subunit